MDDGANGNLNDDELEEQMENKIINEEYKIWKKNAPFLYDFLLSNALEWPTLTTQWLPDKQSVPGKNFSTHRLLIGTHTSNDAQNYLQIAHVQLPNPVTPDAADYDEEREEIGGYGKRPQGEIKFSIVQKIDHPGEVNKARYMPQNPNMIATQCVDARIMIWDRTKHPSEPRGRVDPQMELHGHESEGFGLDWSPHKSGQLATCGEDQTVRVWNINDYTTSNKIINPSRTYTHHTANVGDVKHSPIHHFMIGTASDDLTVQILDTRQATNSRAALSATGHTDCVNTLAFHPTAEMILATGSADKTIGIWDMRNFEKKVHALEAHVDAVTTVDWHPWETAVLASSSIDRRVNFWDLSRAGEEQTPEDAEDGPPELMFMHGGHTSRISDFSFNRNDPWVMASAAEDNLIMVWRVANAIVGRDKGDVPREELE